MQRSLLDKRQTIALCRAHGMPIPNSLAPNSLDDVARAAHDFQFPVIIKPRSTYGVDFPGKNHVGRDPEALQSFFRQHPSLVDQTVIQEIVPSGDGRIVVAASYSGREGRVQAMYTGRKLRQCLPDYGVTCFGVSETIPEIADAARRFLDAVGYRGFAALEFAEDPARRYWFLELNPRTYYHNQLFADAGVDLTQIGYREMAGLEPDTGAVRQRDGVHWLDFSRDLKSFLLKRRAGELGLGPWLASLRKASSFAVFDRSDLRPLRANMTHTVRAAVRGLGNRMRRGRWFEA